jgi:PIN domain
VDDQDSRHGPVNHVAGHLLLAINLVQAMSLPKAAFLDTSVFAGQQYNYASAVLTSFAPVAQKADLKILLPDPTSREVARQIKERSADALKALDDARRKAPFLSKWKHFPPKQTSMAQWELGRIAQTEWNQFLSQFQVEKLGYDGVSIPKVMAWYDSIRAPFGEGKKRKEFPDAFAIEMVSLYAEKHDICVAVVSDDTDIKKACDHYPSLLYFQSLAKLTELLLVGEAELEELRSILSGNLELLEEAVYEQINQFSTYIYDEGYEEEESSISSPQIADIRIVGLGINECTVVFNAEFDSEHKIKWEEVIDPSEGYTQTYSEWVHQSNTVGGTAKLIIDPITKTVASLGTVEVDSSEIELRRLPR